jgi:hypothetical protein
MTPEEDKAPITVAGEADRLLTKIYVIGYILCWPLLYSTLVQGPMAPKTVGDLIITVMIISFINLSWPMIVGVLVLGKLRNVPLPPWLGG